MAAKQTEPRPTFAKQTVISETERTFTINENKGKTSIQRFNTREEEELDFISAWAEPPRKGRKKKGIDSGKQYVSTSPIEEQIDYIDELLNPKSTSEKRKSEKKTGAKRNDRNLNEWSIEEQFELSCGLETPKGQSDKKEVSSRNPFVGSSSVEDEFDFSKALAIPDRVSKQKTDAKIVRSVKRNSVEEKILYCNSCKNDRVTSLAKAYCTVCRQFVCDNCLETDLSRDHLLLKLQRITQESDIGKICAITTSSNAPMAISPLKPLRVAPLKPLALSSNTTYLEEYKFVKDVIVKDPNESKNCHIIGIAILTNGKLAVLDVANTSVKIINTDTSSVEDAMKLNDHPRGIASLPGNQLALTLPNEGKVKILCTIPDLTLDRNLRLGKRCNRVVFFNGKLLVSFIHPLKFLITSLRGEILKTISPKKDVLELCPEPWDIAASQDEQVIFLSNDETNVVITMNTEGAKIATNALWAKLENPHGLHALSDGSVYVCNQKKHELIKLVKNSTEAKVLLNYGDDLRFPAAICVCEEQRELYISSFCSTPKYCDAVKVFKRWK